MPAGVQATRVAGVRLSRSSRPCKRTYRWSAGGTEARGGARRARNGGGACPVQVGALLGGTAKTPSSGGQLAHPWDEARSRRGPGAHGARRVAVTCRVFSTQVHNGLVAGKGGASARRRGSHGERKGCPLHQPKRGSRTRSVRPWERRYLPLHLSSLDEIGVCFTSERSGARCACWCPR